MTIVCGDSHTSTHGAFGALAFGIGTSEVEHVLATQCAVAEQAAQHAHYPSPDELPHGVTSKDLILAIIRATRHRRRYRLRHRVRRARPFALSPWKSA